MPIEPEQFVMLIAALTMVVSAVIGTVAGFGSALLISPVLMIAFGPATTVLTVCAFGVFNATLSLVGDTFTRPRPLPYTREVLLMWAGAAVVTVPGALLLARLPERFITGALGCFILVSVGAIVRGWRPVLTRDRFALVATGGLSQLANTLSGVGGPPVVLYGLASDWQPYRARTTQQTYFLPVNLVTVVVVSMSTAERPLWPLVLLGALATVAALPVRARVRAATVRHLMLGLSVLAGSLALWRALVG